MIKHSDNPLLSVIIPVFNTEEYLHRCIGSIVSQSLQHIEILLINDQSTDRSESIIERYVKGNKAIRYFKTDIRSLAGGARNIGLQNAKGKYIGFVDSDDWIDSNMYEKIIKLLERSTADIAVCGVIKEYESPYDFYRKYSYEFENILEGTFAFDILTNRQNQDIAISPIACNKVYRSQFLKSNAICFPANNYNEDDVFNYLCFSMAKYVAVTPDAYYHYYQRESSITHSFSLKHINDLFDAFGLIKQFLDKHDLFNSHKNNYFSFFERCAGFVLNLLIAKEPSIQKQNKYLGHFLEKAGSVELINDYMQYCGVKRIRYFFNPAIIK